MKTLTISGQTIGKSKFDNLVKNVSSVSESITVLATYCAGLAVVHNDLDALNQRLLKIQAFRNASGEFNALGKKVIQYVAAHTSGFMTYEAKSGSFSFKKFSGKEASQKKAAARGFYHPETGEITQRFIALETPQSMEFSFSFHEFWNFKKQTAASSAPSVKMATVIKSMWKVTDAAEAGNLAGTPEECVTAIHAALNLIDSFAKAGGKELQELWKEQNAIDLNAMLTSVTVTPSSKARAAGKRPRPEVVEPSPVESVPVISEAVAESIKRFDTMTYAELEADMAESRDNAKKYAADA